MKKLLGIILLVLFAITILFSVNNNIKSTTSNDSPGYASIIPIPPPEPPARRGC
jgi:hypothetical protein